ncbi:flagellar basal body P-ring formation chaperone FlgA [Vibrio spartinae]|uniref:Flagella basal body P-ring formation protein FlgA n=1 Tax=Vibrio spartinae TaxID=1918945 RepID=A0A1N6M0W3_9VIBR|nr:flagellar basal body P-ring formation chaperone FlgA [Vibrio spartinae]QMV15173.1 flagellar basal body P-ring biosynthesis protein FlgA [Vibrio spartinae]SIO93042.1 flagellar basal body P-ring biosynthesis protein FlgA [Vibrio spartinae]
MFKKLCLSPLPFTKCRAFFKLFYSIIVILSVFFNISTQAATQEQLDHIRETAEKYATTVIEHPTGGKIVATAAPLDNRIQASDCPTGLKAFSSSRNGSASHITVLVECPTDNWRIYVPVRLNITVPAVLATTPLNRGQIITQQDVSLGMVDLLRFRQQGFSTIDQVIGAKVKRNIPLNDIISDRDICIVCRNETVTIKAIKNGLSIITQGTALSDGDLGEQIRVKNNKSNRIIDAQVSGIGEVTVRF